MIVFRVIDKDKIPFLHLMDLVNTSGMAVLIAYELRAEEFCEPLNGYRRRKFHE